MKFTIGFSPCPNDTFIFDALVNGKLDTGGLEFQVMLEDVQTLNEWALQGRLDISKISYGVLWQVLEEYITLPAGGALGKGVGPLLISAKAQGEAADINTSRVAIPGINTTAHMLFNQAFPQAANREFMVFDQIEQAVLSGECEYGVIIHENRFTYASRGLYKHMDLGAYWETQTGLPIPLGGIIMRRKFEPTVIRQVNRLIRTSLEYAFQHYPSLPPFVTENAQEMEPDIMRQHIDLYVNKLSLDPSKEGRQAVIKMLENFGYKSQQPIFAE